MAVIVMIAAAAAMAAMAAVALRLLRVLRRLACINTYLYMFLCVHICLHARTCLIASASPKRRAWQRFVQLIGRNADMRNAWLLCSARVLRLASPERSA